MLLEEDVQDRLVCLGARVLRMEHSSLLPLRDPKNRRLQFSPEHHAVMYLRPMLRGILSLSGGEILLASARFILHQHRVLPRFPGV